MIKLEVAFFAQEWSAALVEEINGTVFIMERAEGKHDRYIPGT